MRARNGGAKERRRALQTGAHRSVARCAPLTPDTLLADAPLTPDTSLALGLASAARSGAVDGQERLGQNIHAVHHLCKLHCAGHAAAGRHECVSAAHTEGRPRACARPSPWARGTCGAAGLFERTPPQSMWSTRTCASWATWCLTCGTVAGMKTCMTRSHDVPRALTPPRIVLYAC